MSEEVQNIKIKALEAEDRRIEQRLAELEVSVQSLLAALSLPPGTYVHEPDPRQ